MRRKLTKRNKQFLSSRYTQSYGGNGSFQQVRCTKMYTKIYGDDDNFEYKISYKWRWWHSAEWFADLIRNVSAEDLYRYEEWGA